MSTLTSRKLKWLAFLTVDVLLAVVLVWLFMVRAEHRELEELGDLGVSLFPEPNTLTPFSLTDHNGDQFTGADLAGRWSLIFFGFTHCPDICPLTMRELAQFYQELEQNDGLGDLARPQIIMATVDPARDRPEQLREYLNNYHPDFVGLTGSDEQLAVLASRLFVVRASAEDNDNKEETHAGHGSGDGSAQGGFDHSGHISVINPRGELVAALRLPHRARDILAAYRYFAD